MFDRAEVVAGPIFHFVALERVSRHDARSRAIVAMPVIFSAVQSCSFSRLYVHDPVSNSENNCFAAAYAQRVLSISQMTHALSQRNLIRVWEIPYGCAAARGDVECTALHGATMTARRKILEMSDDEHLPVAQSVRLGAALVVEHGGRGRPGL